VGKNKVEDAVLRLDMLTKEESLMVLVRNLEIAHRVDVVVHDVDGNVKATKVLTEDIDRNVQSTKVLTENIDGNVKATKVITEDIDNNVKAIQGVAHSVDNGTLSIIILHSQTDFPIVSQHSRTRA
jgi:hypothetical protein